MTDDVANMRRVLDNHRSYFQQRET